MVMYTLNPEEISLDRFFELIRIRKMLPGRVMLHDKIDERLKILKNEDLNTLADLIRNLGSKPKIKAFALKSGLSQEYLVLLKREAGSYLARPFPLSDFPGIPFEFTEVLRSKGMRNTREFFEWCQIEHQQNELAGHTGIPVHRLQELSALCDLSRITGVGGFMARAIYETGIRSTQQFAVSDAHTFDHFGEDDIQYCIAYAKVIVECERKNIQE